MKHSTAVYRSSESQLLKYHRTLRLTIFHGLRTTTVCPFTDGPALESTPHAGG